MVTLTELREREKDLKGQIRKAATSGLPGKVASARIASLQPKVRSVRTQIRIMELQEQGATTQQVESFRRVRQQIESDERLQEVRARQIRTTGRTTGIPSSLDAPPGTARERARTRAVALREDPTRDIVTPVGRVRKAIQPLSQRSLERRGFSASEIKQIREQQPSVREQILQNREFPTQFTITDQVPLTEGNIATTQPVRAAPPPQLQTPGLPLITSEGIFSEAKTDDKGFVPPAPIQFGGKIREAGRFTVPLAVQFGGQIQTARPTSNIIKRLTQLGAKTARTPEAEGVIEAGTEVTKGFGDLVIGTSPVVFEEGGVRFRTEQEMIAQTTTPRANAARAALALTAIEAITISTGGVAGRVLGGTAQALAVPELITQSQKTVIDKQAREIQREAQESVVSGIGFGSVKASAQSIAAEVSPLTVKRVDFVREAKKVARARGISEDKIGAVVREAVKSRGIAGAGELLNIVNVERNIELTGLKTFNKFFQKQAGKRFSRESLEVALKKAAKPRFTFLGIAEGVGQVYGQQKIRGKQPTATELGFAAGIGGLGARFIGTQAILTPIRRVRGKVANIFGQIVDAPFEFLGDISATVTRKGAREVAGIRSKVPAIIQSGGKIRGVPKTFGLTTVDDVTSILPRTTRVRAPTVTPRVSRELFVSAPSRRGRAPTAFTTVAPIPVSEPVSTISPITTGAPVTVPTPVPTSRITVPSTFTEPIPIPLRERIPSPVSTPVSTPVTVPVVSAPFPLIPLFGGGLFGGRVQARTGLKTRFAPSLFGIISGKRATKAQAGRSFSGFEVRGVPDIGMGKIGGLFGAISRRPRTRGFDTRMPRGLPKVKVGKGLANLKVPKGLNSLTR